jgi:hypothetical protein
MLGAIVVTSDGDELGKVQEVAGTCFKVDASMQPDYWLGNDTIADAAGSAIRLAIPKDQVGDAKLDESEHRGIHRHSA